MTAYLAAGRVSPTKDGVHELLAARADALSRILALKPPNNTTNAKDVVPWAVEQAP
jgi:hypothetical protein